MTPALFHRTDVKRMTNLALRETGDSFSDFAGQLAEDAVMLRADRLVNGRRLQEDFEWWALREWARCRDELMARHALRKEKSK